MRKFLSEMALVFVFALMLAGSMFIFLGPDQAALVVIVMFDLVERYWPALTGIGAGIGAVLIVVMFIIGWWRSKNG